MAIQKPNLEKFKKNHSAQSQNHNKSNSNASNDDASANIMMEMGKAFLPKLPKKFKYAIGAAIFFLAWGVISFNYCMINWLAWGYFFAITLALEVLQINDELKISQKILSLIKTKK